MSSHREAPEISKDPVADNTDTYAFVSPDKPDSVTIITNYIPLENPPGGPNFFEFGDDVLYSIYVDNNGDGLPDIEYRFKFKTKVRSEKTFLYNTGPISSIGSSNWNRRQFYDVSRVDYRNKGRSAKLAEVISPATVPTEPEAANLPLIIGLGLVLGLMLGIGFAFVWDRVRGRLRGAADVKRQTGLEVLAQVPVVKQQFPLAPQIGPSTPAREVFGYLAAHLTTLTTRGKGA